MGSVHHSRRYELIKAIRKLPNLIGYYPVNEVSGNICLNYAVATRGKNNGTYNGSPSIGQSGLRGRCADLDGTDDYIRLTQDVSLPLYNNTNFSIGMFVYKASWLTTNDRRLFAEGSSSTNSPVYSFGQSASGKERKLLFWVRDNSAIDKVQLDTTVDVLVDGKLQLIGLTDANGTVKLYIDGVEKDAGRFNYTRGTLTLNRTGFGVLQRTTLGGYLQAKFNHAFLTNGILADTDYKRLCRIAGIT